MDQPERAAEIVARMRRSVPAGQMRLIELVAEQAEALGVRVYVVGGFVRDLLTGVQGTKSGKTDLDFVMETDAPTFASKIQAQFGGKITPHARFGTATWHIDEAVSLNTGITDTAYVDFVTARRESYPEPGVLPVVEPSTISDDLQRRDFTINAMAIRLAPAPFGTLIDPLHGERDLSYKTIRVLHDKSFSDDATRIFRAARFEQRFGFEIDPQTQALIIPALWTLDKISGERLRTELDVIFLESRPELSLMRLEELGVLTVTHRVLQVDEMVAAAFQALREFPLRINLSDAYEIVLGCRVEKPVDVESLAARLSLDATRMKHLHQGQMLYQRLPALQGQIKPSEVDKLLGKVDNEVVAALWALAEDLADCETARERLISYAELWRDKQPTLTGDELLAMGLLPSPRIGKIKSALREALLDGAITTPDDERAFVQDWLRKNP